MEELIITNTYDIQNAFEGDGRLNLEGYCCHFDVMNLNQQVVDADSFKYFFNLYREGKMKPALNYEHTTNIIGGIDSIEVVDKGLYMKAHLNKSVPLNDMIIPNIIAGDIKSFSTEGFVKDGYEGLVELNNGGVYIKNFILTAVAVVSVPADFDAVFSVTNMLEGYSKWKTENAVNEVKRLPISLLL